MRIFTASLTMLFIACISGCGSSEGEQTNVTPPEVTPPESSVFVSATNTSTAVYENEATIINLKNAIKTSDGSAPVLQAVTPLSQDSQCNQVTLGTLNFTLDAQKPGSCLYEYEASDASTQNVATAYVQVAISGSDAPLISNTSLPTQSATAELSEQITVSLPAPANMTLSNEVTVLGSGIVVDIDPVNNTITYQAGSEENDAGVTRIHYHYSDDADLIRMGVIDIAVSTDTFNQAPQAHDWKYLLAEDFALGLSNTTVKERELITIDIANVLLPDGTTGSLISDPDTDDSLQLIDVQAFNADTALLNSESLTNTSFTFEASMAGHYYITYQITDHLGGYDIGIIEVYVEGTWPDVIVAETNDIFKAPVSLDTATLADYDVAGVSAENAPTEEPPGNGVQNVPVYTWEAADAICRARGGSLPTLSQMSAFVRQEANPYVADDGNEFEMASDWPVERGYFTSTFSSLDSNKVFVYYPRAGYMDSVSSGQDGTSSPYLGYLTCIDKTPQSLTIENTLLIQGIEQQLTATFDTASGVTFPYTKPLYWSTSEPESTSVTAMPNIDTNVTLDKYTGTFHAQAAGYINVRAETPLGDLSTSKDIEVINNLLATGADPTFESFNFEGDTCTVDTVIGNNQMGFSYSSANKYAHSVVYGCASAGNGYPAAPQGNKYMMLRPNNTGFYSFETDPSLTPLNFETGQTYRLTFWFYYNEYGGGSKGGSRLIYFKDENNSNIETCSIMNGYSQDNPSGDLTYIEGNGAINTWTQAYCDFTPSEDYANAYITVRAANKALYIDDMVLLPVN